jgi:hypothetical protein
MQAIRNPLEAGKVCCFGYTASCARFGHLISDTWIRRVVANTQSQARGVGIPLTLPFRGSLPLPASGERAGVRGL